MTRIEDLRALLAEQDDVAFIEGVGRMLATGAQAGDVLASQYPLEVIAVLERMARLTDERRKVALAEADGYEKQALNLRAGADAIRRNMLARGPA